MCVCVCVCVFVCVCVCVCVCVYFKDYLNHYFVQYLTELDSSFFLLHSTVRNKVIKNFACYVLFPRIWFLFLKKGGKKKQNKKQQL